MDTITLQDVETFEKVLRYCSQHKGIHFDKKSEKDIISRTSNIIRWFHDFPIQDLTTRRYSSNTEFKEGELVYYGHNIVAEVTSAWPSTTQTSEEYSIKIPTQKLYSVSVNLLRKKKEE